MKQYKGVMDFNKWSKNTTEKSFYNITSLAEREYFLCCLRMRQKLWNERFAFYKSVSLYEIAEDIGINKKELCDYDICFSYSENMYISFGNFDIDNKEIRDFLNGKTDVFNIVIEVKVKMKGGNLI